MTTQSFRPGTPLEAMIDRLGRDGDGFAGETRVPFALPGEQVLGTVFGNRMADPEILVAAPQRVTPPCRYFGICGGCTLQHASDGFLADWKADTIRRALAARGLATRIRPTAVSPPRSRRRAVLSAKRTKKTVIVGFHRRGTATLVDIEECQVVRPEILAAKPALARLARLGAPRMRNVRLTVTAGPAGLDIDVSGGKVLDASMRACVADIAEAGDLARVAWEGEPVVLRRAPFQKVGGARIVPPAGGFLQATVEGEEMLQAAVREIVGSAARVADLFAGCGTFALPLAEGAQVHAVETVQEMLASLEAGWRSAPGLRQVTTEGRDLFRRPLLGSELGAFDAVVFDPPRSGAEAQCRELARSRVPRIAALSCNPVSFARDAAILTSGGYRLDWIVPIDQFRWAGHVELAAQFSR